MNKYTIYVNDREIYIDADSVNFLNMETPVISFYINEENKLKQVAQFKNWDFWYLDEN